MASIGWEGKRARILFRDGAGKQQTIRLGECRKDDARTAKMAIGHLVIAKRHGSVPHPDAVRWLGGIDDVLYARVVAHGLCQPREGLAVVTLGMLRDRFDSTVRVKPGTTAAYKQGLDSLCQHFGRERDLSTITVLEADQWRQSMVDAKYAPATISKRVQTARNLFRKGARWGILHISPFADVRAGKQHNPERQRFIDRETIGRVIDACPDHEWRLIVGLSRYAGLRCPSEHLALTWQDWDVQRSALTVRAAKTATVRQVPVCPELSHLLQAAFDMAEPGAIWMIARYRERNSNLRTQLHRIIRRAGLTPWPRTFHNLRASCQTEWQERFPLASVCLWIGNTPDVAARHYLTARDVHFEMVGKGEAAANPATNRRPNAYKGDQADSADHTKIPQKQGVLVESGIGWDPVENTKVGAGGFEPP